MTPTQTQIPAPPREQVSVVPSRTLRWLLIIAGTICVGLGLIGLLLPLIPTTPFLLLAAACYARSSERFDNWLLRHRLWGQLIREWRTQRRLPRYAKHVAMLAIVWTFGISTWLWFTVPLICVVSGCCCGCAVFQFRSLLRI